MVQFLFAAPSVTKLLIFQLPDRCTVQDLVHCIQIPSDDVYVVENGRLISDDSYLKDNAVYRIVPRLRGGKGGFGSMLRTLGAQIEKTTNHEACRDLSGRRMRDINNEKKLQEWVAKKADREREREEQRQQRLQRRRDVPRHVFNDATYVEQKSKVAENLDDAVQQGLKRAVQSDSAELAVASKKRVLVDPKPSTSASKCTVAEWLGDIDGGSSSTDSDSDSHQSCSRELPAAACSSNGAAILAVETTNAGAGQSALFVDESTGQSAVAAREQDLSREARAEVMDENGHQSSQGQEQLITEAKELLSADTEIILEAYSSPELLEALGLDRLKTELVARGMKCGGTLKERAHRLFCVRGVATKDIDASLMAAVPGGKGKKPVTGSRR